MANCYPFNYSGKTDPHGFYLGRDKYGTNIIVDFDRRSDDKTNANILILGNTYKIDRVSKAERAASTKVGGCGIRYTIIVDGIPRYLYDEDGKWFMEDEVIIEDNR